MQRCAVSRYPEDRLPALRGSLGLGEEVQGRLREVGEERVAVESGAVAHAGWQHVL